MKHTKKEILDALKLIKDECISAENCEECPFGADIGCTIRRNSPYDWDIVDEKPETWRAFQ